MSVEKAKELLQIAKDSLEAHRVALNAGNAVDMSDAENTIQQLCLAIAELPQEEASGFEQGLQELVGDLQSLSQLLAEQREKLQESIEETARQQQAAQAYAQSGKNAIPPSED